MHVVAQISAGSIQGIVTDSSSHLPLPSVQVTIKNLATNSARTLIADSKGFYAASNLAPGDYQVIASKPGFTNVMARISLAVGVNKVWNVSLHAGAANTEPRPDSATNVDAGSSSVGGVISSSTVRDLPANGRDWTQAATLQAGVSSVRTQPDATNTNSGRGQRGFGAQISVSGGRPQQNNYLLDGISINDYANSAPGSVLGLDLGADAVEEFSVVTSNYPAEYGRSSGGIINAVTRSGSKDFHGSIYEFLRNSALDARNFFDVKKPPFRRNQFGASAGGPIRKDRTFIFGNYEGLNQSLGITHVDTVPSLTARQGLLSTGAVNVNPLIVPYFNFYPLPNGGILSPGDTGIFNFSGQQVTHENYFTTRIDQRLRQQDSLVGTYSFDAAHTLQPDELNTKLTQNQTQRQLITLQESHVFSRQLLNTARFGFNRVVALIGHTPTAINPLASDASLGFVPGLTAGRISVLGLTDFGGGLGAVSVFNFHWNSFQFYDDAALKAGKHSLKFGLSLERMQDNMLATSDPNGVFDFHSLSDFISNRPFSLTVALPGNISPRNLRQTVFGAYLQDDYRLFPNLTLNLGGRYEMATVPTEVRGKLSTLRHLTDAQPHLGDPYFSNPTLLNFEPRVGLAWDPLGNGRVAVRSGFGIFDVLPLPYEFELLSLFPAPFFQLGTPTNLPAGSFPNNAFILASTNPNLLRNVFVQPQPKRNYVMQWNLNLEFEPTKNLNALIGYVGSRGVHQPFRADDINMVLPSLTPAGYLWPASGQKLNPNSGRLDGLFWEGNSYYDALQLQIKNRPVHGFQIQGSYTWGKSIDTGSATIAGDQFANSISSLPWFDLRLNRGPSDFNIGQNLSIHSTWDLPSPNSTSVIMWAAQGWRFGANYQASSGSPFTIVLGGDPLGMNSTDPFDVPNRITGPGCGSAVNQGNPTNYLKLQCFSFPNPARLRGNLGRNSLTGPGLSNLDISIFKNNYIKKISEHFNAQFRIEAFNILNHANFAPPLDHRSIFDQNGNIVPGAGLIDSTQTPSRQIQFGLKLIW